MKLVLAIGNPGPEYAGTRHNIAWDVVDRLHARLRGGAWRRRFDSDVAEVEDAGARALLLKPRTYVNLSGGPAQAALAFHQAPPADLLVVSDDLHLDLGDLRLRAEGSAGGHNGLKDIIARIGPGFPRLRVGVGRMPPGFDQVAFVLGRFAEEQRADAAAGAEKAAEAVRAWLHEGVAVACRFNGPLRPPPPRPKPPPGHDAGTALERDPRGA